MTSAAGSMPTDGRWDRYRDHNGTEFQRVSTLIKKVETDDYHLRLWERRQVLIGASRRDDIVTGVKAMKPHPITGWSDAQKKDLNALVKTAEEAAKDSDGAVLGTATHTLTERLDRGEPLDDVIRGLPAQIEADVRAYEALVRLNGWRSVEIERTVVNDEIDVAGTLDRVYEIPGLVALLGPWICQHGHTHVGRDGESSQVIGDVKSERSPEKNGLHIGPQLAIYARARRMWLPGAPSSGPGVAPTAPGYVDTPCVRQDVAVAVHVRDGHATPYFVDIRSGWDAALAARAQNDREKAAKTWLAPVPGIREPAPAEIATAVAVSQDYGNPDRPGALVMPPLPDFAGTVKDVKPMYPVGEQGPEVRSMPAGSVILDDVDRQAIDTVWSAGNLDGLARVFEIYTGTVGREWRGRVAEAGAARRAQIECVQRTTHGAPGGLKCACGWTKGILP